MKNYNQWHDHDGESDPPINGLTFVQVRFADGDTAFGEVYDWDQNWQWKGFADYTLEGRIVAWRRAFPRYCCQYCGEPVGYLGRFLAKLFGAGLHGCRRKIDKHEEDSHEHIMNFYMTQNQKMINALTEIIMLKNDSDVGAAQDIAHKVLDAL